MQGRSWTYQNTNWTNLCTYRPKYVFLKLRFVTNNSVYLQQLLDDTTKSNCTWDLTKKEVRVLYAYLPFIKACVTACWWGGPKHSMGSVGTFLWWLFWNLFTILRKEIIFVKANGDIYYYYYLLQLNFHSVAVVLTLVTNYSKYT